MKATKKSAPKTKAAKPKKETKPKATAKKKATKSENNVTIEAEKMLSETEVVVVLDRSGSMGSIANSTVEGFNTLIKEQKNAEGSAFVTLVQFDDRYEINYQSIPVNQVSDLIVGETFVPRGMTALHDAIGKTINELKTDRDVTFVIITDGHENASTEFTGEAVKKMIQTQENDKKWKFVYMGANQDAVTVSQKFGIKGQNAMTYTADNEHVTMAFMNVSSNLSSMRSSKMNYLKTMKVDTNVQYGAATMDMMEKDLSFSDEQRISSVDNSKK